MKKKSNMLKRQELIARATTKGLGVIYCVGCGYALFDVKTKKIFTATRAQKKAFGEYRHRWTINIAVVLETGTERYIKAKVLTYGKTPYFQSELADVNNKEHFDLIHEQNESHLVNAGWIGFTYDYDIDSETMLELFERHGAYEYAIKYKESQK